MKNVLLSLSFIMIFGLIGYTHTNESESEQNDGSRSNEKIQEVNLIHNEKPPTLTLTVGEDVIHAKLGGYSWSYLDTKTEQMVRVEAESLPSTEIVDIENAVSVNLIENIKINFENEPIEYEIRAYDKINNVIATYHEFKDVKEKGKTIYDIVVTWDNGKVIYVAALDVQ